MALKCHIAPLVGHWHKNRLRTRLWQNRQLESPGCRYRFRCSL